MSPIDLMMRTADKDVTHNNPATATVGLCNLELKVPDFTHKSAIARTANCNIIPPNILFSAKVPLPPEDAVSVVTSSGSSVAVASNTNPKKARAIFVCSAMASMK